MCLLCLESVCVWVLWFLIDAGGELCLWSSQMKGKETSGRGEEEWDLWGSDACLESFRSDCLLLEEFVWIILLHERWRYDSLIIYTLTWSPGCGLIRETWSYPRRKRARIASSLPWTGDKNTYNVLWTPAASVNNDSDSYPDGRIPLPVLSGLPVWLSGLGFEGFKLLLGHLYDSVFGFFQLGSLLGGALASPANLEQSQKHQIISSETCHIISPALQHTQLSASFWDETSSNLKSLFIINLISINYIQYQSKVWNDYNLDLFLNICFLLLTKVTFIWSKIQ